MKKTVFSLLVVVLLCETGLARSFQTVNECLSLKVLTALDEMTVAELKIECKQEITETEGDERVDLVEERIAQDEKNVLSPFTLMAHRPNYILTGVYNEKGYDSTTHNEVFTDEISYKDYESQFQLSIKFPLLVDLFNGRADIYAAYTNRSFWQIFHEDSSPFRETNHEPETWVQFHPGWEILGFKNSWNSIGFNHQSNGQGDELSRSWNRIFGWFTFERDKFSFSLRPWYRIPEPEREDDNEDITEYLGHFELLAAYKYRDHVFNMLSRNNLESGFERGAVQFGWSFPLWKYPYLKGYLQWFYGYGESLVDYNQKSNRIGLGLVLVDWL